MAMFDILNGAGQQPSQSGGWGQDSGWAQGLTQLGIGLMSNRDPFQGAALGFSGLNEKLAEAQKRQRMLSALNSNGMLGKLDPGMRDYLAQDPEAARGAFQSMIASKLKALQPQAADGLSAWQKAQLDLDNRRLALDQQKAAGGGAGGANEFGLQPVYAKDPNGNTVIVQMGKNGKPNLVQLPNGVMVDPGQIAQDKAAGRAIGEVQGKAAASISSVDSDVERMGKQVDDLLESPGLNNAVGPIQSRLPTFRGSTANAEARIEQIKGAAFLQAIPQMTGMGALSNVEGATATAAIARLNMAQDDEGFRQALADLKEVFDSARARVRAKAGGYAPKASVKDQARPPALEQLDGGQPAPASGGWGYGGVVK